MRIQFIKLIGSGVKVRFSTDVPRQKDELEERGRYQCLIGCRFDQSEAIEYELKKAKRNDYYCSWREIKEAKKMKEIVANRIKAIKEYLKQVQEELKVLNNA